MTKKATPKIYFILLLLFILLTGCSDKKASESAVSPEAEAVITAMFTAPNEELYSQDASNVIGENTDANSDDAFANSEKILENWNKLVGKYFENGIEYEYSDGKFIRHLKIAENVSHIDSDKLGKALGEYIRLMDSEIKIYFENLDFPESAVIKVEKLYNEHLPYMTII